MFLDIYWRMEVPCLVRVEGLKTCGGVLYPLRKRRGVRHGARRAIPPAQKVFLSWGFTRILPSLRRKTRGKLEACSDDQASQTSLLSGCRSCSPKFLLRSVTIRFIQPLKKNLFLRGYSSPCLCVPCQEKINKPPRLKSAEGAYHPVAI